MTRRDQQLFPDPATRVVWAGICALAEASQHDVLRELGKRLAYPNERGPMNTREVRFARAIAALREAAAALGKSPSVREYRELRKTAHPDWPPDGSIRGWLAGGWNECLKQAHLEVLPDDAPITVEGQQAYSEEEVLAALRECAKDLGRNPDVQQLHQLGSKPGGSQEAWPPTTISERFRATLRQLPEGHDHRRLG